MGFNLNDYEPVADRLTKFWADHPDGRIETTLLSAPDRFAADGIAFKAAVFRRAEDPYPAATGYAHEHVTERGVNSTSALENSETSSIGRALANCGYGAKSAARPSREEMSKARVPEETEGEPAPIQQYQMNTIYALWGELKLDGDENQEKRHDVMSKILRRPIGSHKDLTAAEAHRVIFEQRKRVAARKAPA